MQSNKSRSVLAGLALAGLSLVVYTQNVEARSAGGALGRVVTPGDAGCFNMVNGGVVNSCGGGTRKYEAALVNDSSGNKNVSITHSSLSTVCYAFAKNKDDTAGYIPGSTTIITEPSGWRTTNLNGVFAPAGGALFGGCNVAAGDRLQTFNWTP